MPRSATVASATPSSRVLAAPSGARTSGTPIGMVRSTCLMAPGRPAWLRGGSTTSIRSGRTTGASTIAIVCDSSPSLCERTKRAPRSRNHSKVRGARTGRVAHGEKSSDERAGAASALELPWSWFRGRKSPASKVGTGSGILGAASSRCSSTKASATATTSLIPVAVERSGRDPSLRARIEALSRPLRRPAVGRAPRLPAPWAARACRAGRFRGGDLSRAGGVRRPMGAAGGSRGGANDEGDRARTRGGGCGCYSATRPISQTPAATRSSIARSSRASALSSRSSEASVWTTTGCLPQS